MDAVSVSDGSDSVPVQELSPDQMSLTGVDVSFDGGTGFRQPNPAPGGAVSSGPPSGINLSRKESYKDQRRKYRCEKRRAADELLNTLRDPSVIVRADWLKVRGTLKGWTKLWAVLKPGMLVLFKSEKTKNSHWVGTILLASCQLIERPSKKDGFCFKLFHPLEQSIWSTKGPDGESHTGVALNPLPNAYLICRVTSQSVGKCWMDALELCMSCSSLLKRSMQQVDSGSRLSCNESDAENTDPVFSSCLLSPAVAFDDVTADGDGDDSSDVSALDDDRLSSPRESPAPLETPYVANEEVFHVDVLGMGQTEELGDDNKNLLWFLLKQLRPGMDLSKVVLPTFILEPRSFLDKLTDYYYHADHLSRVVHMNDPYERMKNIVAWYLSGFYKKPKGLKKPYNPILGETFRCYWQHPNGSRTYYIAEQVSHHPPISAFYVSNRKDGFCLSSTILAKSKFYGNSTSAILEGTALLTLLPRGEVYQVNMPYAHCKGILLGTLSVELGGKVTIACEKTGYTAEMDFKLKPLWSGQEECNRVVGRIKLGRETLATIEGKWDSLISYTDKRSGETAVLWESTAEIRSQRLPRFTVPLDQQGEWESERLWSAVSREIAAEDQEAATHQKYLLEEAQRAGARQRKADNSEWSTKHFDLDCGTGQYVYRYSDLRPWDPHSDLYQYECDYQVLTKTRLRAPLPRTGSVISVDLKQISKGELCSVPGIGGAIRGCRTRNSSSSPETSVIDSAVRAAGTGAAILTSSAAAGRKEHITTLRLQQLLQPVEQLQQATNSELAAVRRQLQTIQQRLLTDDRRTTSPWLVLLVALVVQFVITWYVAQ